MTIYRAPPILKRDMHPIGIAVIDVRYCCSSPVQGINYYGKTGEQETVGLMHWDSGGYRHWNIR